MLDAEGADQPVIVTAVFNQHMRAAKVITIGIGCAGIAAETQAAQGLRGGNIRTTCRKAGMIALAKEPRHVMRSCWIGGGAALSCKM